MSKELLEDLAISGQHGMAFVFTTYDKNCLPVMHKLHPSVTTVLSGRAWLCCREQLLVLKNSYPSPHIY